MFLLNENPVHTLPLYLSHPNRYTLKIRPNIPIRHEA